MREEDAELRTTLEGRVSRLFGFNMLSKCDGPVS